MKRFWTEAVAVADGDRWRIELDGRPVRTPAGRPLLVPSEALALGIADEWESSEEKVDPRAMPLTGLANAAIDRVADDHDGFARSLATYGESDLTCYRAAHPTTLVERQAAAWDPPLQWARRRYDVDFALTDGAMHVAQDESCLRRLAHEVAALDDFRLAAMSPLVTIAGSLVIALAVAEGAMSPDEAWHAASVEERYQAEQWGNDVEAKAALDLRERDFLNAARFLALLD